MYNDRPQRARKKDRNERKSAFVGLTVGRDQSTTFRPELVFFLFRLLLLLLGRSQAAQWELELANRLSHRVPT